MPAGISHVLHARWILLIMAFCCFFVLSSQRINMSIAILSMVKWKALEDSTTNHCKIIPNNGSLHEEDGEFIWKPSLQAHIHASYLYGLIIMQFPTEILVERFKPEIIALIGLMISSICSIVTPFSVYWHIGCLLCVQITKALGHALVFPAFSVMLGKWIPTKQLIRYVAYSTIGIPLGAFFTVLVGGIICSTEGYRWPFLFYSSGVMGVVWCLLWGYLCYEISFMPILTSRRNLSGSTFPRRQLSVPIRKILLSKHFWGYVISGVASYWMIGMNIFIMPTYFKMVFGISIEWNGVVSSFPNVLQGVLYLFSFVILRKKAASKTAVRRTITCAGMAVFSTCIVLLTFVKCKRALGVMLMVIGVGASGFNLAAISLIPGDMSTHFAGILSGLMNTIGAIAGCGLPLTVGYFTEHAQDDFRNWEKIFYACAFVTFISMILFMAYSSCETQPWNDPGDQSPRIDEPLTLLEPRATTSGIKYPEGTRRRSNTSREARKRDSKMSSGTTFAENSEKKESFLERCLQERYILALMGFGCFFVLSALRLNISLAIVAMVNWGVVRDKQGFDPYTNQSCHFPESEERSNTEDGPFTWGTDRQGHILGCYFYGLAATQLLGGRLSELFSAKLVLLIGTLTATVCTLLVPILASQDGYALMLLQVFKGFGQGIIMPSFSVLMAKWVPAVERARFMAIVASGMPVGGFLTVILSGVICRVRSLGWKYVFYIFGGVGAVWCLLWLLLIHDTPLTNPRITRKELNRIMSLRTQQAPKLNVAVPIKAILTSKPVWAYIAAGFASFWCLSLYVSVVPLFMGTILKFDIEKNGKLSAVPNIVEAFFLICTSLVSDYLLKKKILSTTTIRKIAISIGLCGYALCMITVTFTGCNRTLSVTFLVMALGMCGFNFASTAVVPVDMSPRFAGTISGIMNTFGALSGIIIPAAIGYLTKARQTMDEWSIMFYASATICVFAVIIFLSFGSSEIQPWNSPPRIPSLMSSDFVLQDSSTAVTDSFKKDDDSSGPSGSKSTLMPKRSSRTKTEKSRRASKTNTEEEPKLYSISSWISTEKL